MRKLAIVLLLMVTTTAFASTEILGYKLNGEFVQSSEDAAEFIAELNRMKENEDYEVDVDLCIVYGEEGDEALNEQLDSVLSEASFSMELEGIYGSFGDHMFEIYDTVSGDYLGALNGIYECE